MKGEWVWIFRSHQAGQRFWRSVVMPDRWVLVACVHKKGENWFGRLYTIWPRLMPEQSSITKIEELPGEGFAWDTAVRAKGQLDMLIERKMRDWIPK